MVNIRIRERTNSFGNSPRLEIGEIDTRAPFQSVKAAVSLFGEVAVSKGKPAVRKSKLSSENVIDKETQLLLAQKELSKFKHQLESAETTKARAASELERAKITEEELTSKLKIVNQFKQSAKEAAEEVKSKAKKLELAQSENTLKTSAWKQELDLARSEYTSIVVDLDAAKQELTKIRQDFDAALESKLAAFQQAAEAQRSVKLNAERVRELSQEIVSMRESIEQLQFASMEAQEAQDAMVTEKEACLEHYKTAKAEVEKKLLSMRKEFDPQQTKFLEGKLIETSADIETLQDQMRKAHGSETEFEKAVAGELNEEKKVLQEVEEEESSLRNLLSFLRLELENVKREQDELEKMQTAEESLVSTMPNEMKKNAFEQRTKSEADRTAIEEAEMRLQVAMKEAEEAKAAEKKALSEMKNLSETQESHTADTAEEEGGKIIKLTVEKFESLCRKVEEFQNLAENEEATSMAEIEAIDERKEAAEKKMEANLKAIEEIKAATEMAVKNAGMAESAKKVVEGELQRWRQEERNVNATQATSGHIYF